MIKGVEPEEGGGGGGKAKKVNWDYSLKNWRKVPRTPGQTFSLYIYIFYMELNQMIFQ